MLRLNEVLNGNENNYILPFFWQHGEDEYILREYMQKIYSSGIKAVCVEARPHPQFVGKKWWNDMDIILDEAKKRNMKVWFLDDSHFPTGYANGRVKEEYPHLRKQFLKINQHDFLGPVKNAKVITKWTKATKRGRVDKNDEVIGVIVAKKISFDEVDPTTLIDVSSYISNGILKYDLPEGEWRVFTLVKTYNGSEPATEGYLNPIVPEATKILIETVYEAHYERYKDEFGKTIAGFFSDEPRFGNITGPNASIGRCEMVLPWSEGMLEKLQEEKEDNILEQLPLLLVNGKDKEHTIRYHYMNIVSKLYADNFTKQIGDWCRERGVEYIGHVIEDNNAHARLGYGAGHFFRSLWGQDMSGIDVVLHQLLPGMDNGYFKSFTSTGWDGEFFHYGLAKLGSSLGHMDPKKKGRTMCEVFGAYGWGEGIKLMKWITDHMLVRGVNYFVPHAFSPKEYPDPDCPPHFYAGGKNPQFRHFDILMNYMNRMSHLLNGGKHIAQVVLLYHGEAEWSGNYMLFQKPARELTQNQIDFDIVPADIFIKSKINNSKVLINEEEFEYIVIPYSEYLPKLFIEKIHEFLDSNIKVIFIDDAPVNSSEGIDLSDLLVIIRKHKNTSVVKLEELSDHLKKQGAFEILAESKEKYLRYYHYKQEDGDVFMFFNEHPYNSCNTNIELPMTSELYQYNALDNTLSKKESTQTENGCKFNLKLEAYESNIIILNNNKDISNLNYIIREDSEKLYTKEYSSDISEDWSISFTDSKNYPNFTNEMELKKLIDISDIDGYEDFSGTIRYEKTINIDKVLDKVTLDIDEPYEIVEVKIDNLSVGRKICKPYVFDITNYVKQGNNRIEIEVTNTLVNENPDFLSQYMIIEPVGITGNIKLNMFNKNK